ncbi:MAG: hypothetical protein ACI9CF_000510 [Candidatus Omnitrophota bacterium]|jgi:hypothetical protein
MKTLVNLKKHLKPGRVYRRSELERWSNSVDRHLKLLVEDESLCKLAQGMYSCPAKASFGNIPPEDGVLVRAFLKSDDFLLASPNHYNSLGVGTTQLYNKSVVYNHKRHGRFTLGGKEFYFHLKHKFPKKLSEEFLLVDLMNNLHDLAEDRGYVLKNVKEKVLRMTELQAKKMFNAYAGERTKALFNQWISKKSLVHAQLPS